MDMTKVDWAALAFIGDAVYEVYIRKYVLAGAVGGEPEGGRTEGAARVDRLHRQTVRFVNAKAQARAVKQIVHELPDEYQAIVRKARNHKPATVPKSADVMEYKWATALEALIGHLYLEGETEMLEEVTARAIELIESDKDS